MINKQKGFIGILIAVIAAIVILGGGFAIYHRDEVKDSQAKQTSTSTPDETDRPITDDINTAISASTTISEPENSVQLNSLSKDSGPIGTDVTIFGSGFTPTDNSIKLSGFTAATVDSPDGKSISFSIPSTLNNCTDKYCTATIINVSAGIHPVQVINNNGTSNTLSFNIVEIDSVQ